MNTSLGAAKQHISLLRHPHQPPAPHRDTASAGDAAHRQLLDGEFWRALPGYRQVDTPTFLDHHWQGKHSITSVKKLREAVGSAVSEAFYDDLLAGLGRAPMSVRVTPYLIALIDWSAPESDPLRKQFLPLGSELEPDHPMVGLDSLCEQAHSPVAGLTHRYPDKALLLALDTCPVYCRYCTRSYAVGMDTEKVDKVQLSAQSARWQNAFDYIRSHPAIEDIVVSGGDTYQLKAAHVELIGNALLDIDHVRRIRFATKGPAVMPMKLLSDDAWFRALVGVVQRGRERDKSVVMHTHFDHPSEITAITRQAMSRLFREGVTVRSQCVLLRGVNDDAGTMRTLVRRMGYCNVQAYYVYQHDFVQGVEDLRTSLHQALEIEKQVRGATAGFNTPTFVVDLPGGGGKRDAHSFEHYDRTTGISVYRSPNCDQDRHYLYFDPLSQLPVEGRERWADERERRRMVDVALENATTSAA